MKRCARIDPDPPTTEQSEGLRTTSTKRGASEASAAAAAASDVAVVAGAALRMGSVRKSAVSRLSGGIENGGVHTSPLLSALKSMSTICAGRGVTSEKAEGKEQGRAVCVCQIVL